MTIGPFTIEQIPEAARQFVEAMAEHTIFAFQAPMGVGKTTFIKAICQELGVQDVITSPTFAIVNEYEAASGQPIYHFDFYRIRRLSEAYDMGCEEYFASGNPCFIEWPEMIEDLLPEDAVAVIITENSDGSRLVEMK